MKTVVRGVAARVARQLGPQILDAVDDSVARGLREDVAIRAILASVLHEDGTYVDVGTNRGQVLKEAVRAAPRGHHVAFEPLPDLAAALRREFPRVTCHEAAVAAEAATASFVHFRAMDGWSGLRRRQEISDEIGQPETIEVKVVTLDDVLGGVSPQVVKIDVEGAELEVLRGATRVLSDRRPVVIFEHEPVAARLYGGTSAEVWTILDEQGYRLFAITGEGPLDRSTFAAGTSLNWLASPRR